jgi:EAL domain-containing protein (putative c-di-GMP-specific phosphodiesterase class I)
VVLQIDTASGRVAAVEALARWNHPTLGRLAAGDLIPIAENRGLVPQLGRHVMGQAFAQALRWSSTAPVSVAVNLSAKELARDSVVNEISGCSTASAAHRTYDTVVVQAIIKLVHALDLTSVAEGVETADQLRGSGRVAA